MFVKLPNFVIIIIKMCLALIYYNLISKDNNGNKPNTESINDVINETVIFAVAYIKGGGLFQTNNTYIKLKCMY